MATDATTEQLRIWTDGSDDGDDTVAMSDLRTAVAGDDAIAASAMPPADPIRTSALPDRAALAAIRLLFDRAFYLSCHPDVAASGIDPLDHFLTSGLAEGRSPCALFDTDFYLHQPGAPATRDSVFLHYLKFGIRAQLDPHPLLDARFYARQAPALQEGTNPLTHLLGAGRRENRRPNPLFDMSYYRRRLRGDDKAMHPLIHYVLHGWRARLQPHPLFDPVAYLEQRPDIEAVGIDPLAHYLRQGIHEQVRPHWLFDAVHYAASCRDTITPDEALLHFATWGSGPGRSPNPLFDAAHYLHQHPDLATTGTDPFLHFLEFGLAENRDPHPLFDTWFYRSQNSDVVENDVPPFIHYVRYGAREGRDPNPFFPALHYMLLHPDARDELAGPLAHFLRVPDVWLEPLCDEFDPSYYLACHPACAEAVDAGMPPLSHYLSTGRADRLSPMPLPIDRHDWRVPVAGPTPARPPADARVTSILLVVQDASHADAAACALRAVQEMAGDAELDCRVVIRQDGPLSAAFAALVPTLVLPTDRPGTAGETDRMADVLYSFHDMSADGIVVVTSTAMSDIVSLAGRLQLRLLAWLHEMPVTIDSLLGGRQTMHTLSRVASRILASSDATRAALVDHYDLSAEQVVAIPDGVTPPPAGLDLRRASLTLRDHLGLPPDALVVLGSGTIDFRNGTDLFIRVASLVMARVRETVCSASALHQACFLWIGVSDDPLFAALCRNDIVRLGLSERVQLLAPQDRPEQELLGEALVGADMFLQTGRDAAAGIAGHDARSSGLPIIGFTGGFGDTDPTVEAETLIEVGYLDLDAMADAIMTRGNRPARRTRASRPPAPTVPSWADWHQSLRRLLADGGNAAAGTGLPDDQQAVTSDAPAVPA